MTVNNSSSFSSGFRKLLLRSDVELPGHAENDKVEQFRHVKMNELFSPAGLTSQVLYCSFGNSTTHCVALGHPCCVLIAVFVNLNCTMS